MAVSSEQRGVEKQEVLGIGAGTASLQLQNLK